MDTYFGLERSFLDGVRPCLIKKHVSSDGTVEGEKGVGQKPTFNVEMKQLHYRRAPGIYTSHLSLERIGNTSVDEMAVHLWRNGLQQPGIPECSSQQTAGACFHATRHGPKR